jgi:two-component sensor histidine kinase
VTILALVLNEMVSNAINHGMAGLTKGIVTIRGREEDGMVIVQVIDTGTKLKQWGPGEEENSEGLGLSLIKNLIGDLGGEFSLWSGGDQGHTVAEVRFPLTRNRGQAPGVGGNIQNLVPGIDEDV